MGDGVTDGAEDDPAETVELPLLAVGADVHPPRAISTPTVGTEMTLVSDLIPTSPHTTRIVPVRAVRRRSLPTRWLCALLTHTCRADLTTVYLLFFTVRSAAAAQFRVARLAAGGVGGDR